MIKLDMKNNFDQWEKSLAKIRKEFPKETEKLVYKHTQNISLGAKQSVPIKHHALKASIRPKVSGLTGDVIVGVYYAPYMEYGTGNKVNVPNELTEYARQFKGRGIRQVNIDPRPYLYPHFFIQRYKFMESMKDMLTRISNNNMNRKAR
jgi:hypothetical protein